MAWVFLVGAIASEVTATLCLRSSDGFSRAVPSAVSVVGYIVAFALLLKVLEHGMSIGVAYAVWSGVGVSLVAIASRFLFNESLSLGTAAGIALIICGVLAIELLG